MKLTSRSCCTTPSAMWFWVVMFLAFYGLGVLITQNWPALDPYGATILLSALGLACVVNFRRNWTLHCGLTGPLFLIAAAVAASMEAGFWNGNMTLLWTVVALGVGLAFVVEWRIAGGPQNIAR